MVWRLPKRSRKVALLEGATAGALFGTAAIFIRFLAVLSVFSIALWRLVIASSVLILLLLVQRQTFRFSELRQDLFRICILGVFLGLHFILFVSAVMDTAIINATVLVNTTPIWSIFISTVTFKLRPSRLAALGITASFLGVGIIAYGDAASKVWTLNLKGDLEAVLAAVVEALYLNYGRDIRRRAQLLTLMLAIYVASAVTVLVAGVVTKSDLTLPTHLTLFLALLGLGLLPTAMAHTFYFSSLSNLKSFETATMALLEPIGATLLGVLIFAEFPNVFFVFGAVFVLSGIISVAIGE